MMLMLLMNFLKSKGIIVRNVANYGLPEYLRISIGAEEEMKLLVEALKAYIG